GTEHRSSADPYVYKMLRSTDVDAHVRAAADEHLEQRELFVAGVEDGPDHATVSAEAPYGERERITARWVFDSRPVAPASTGRTHLLQHFRGWFVRASTELFDPAAAVLMDMRPPQPRHGVAFGYVLPLSRRE